MKEPVLALYLHMMDQGIYRKYIDDLDAYHANLTTSAELHQQLNELLDEKTNELLERLLDERTSVAGAETESAFAAGLAFGFQLLGLD